MDERDELLNVGSYVFGEGRGGFEEAVGGFEEAYEFVQVQ